MWNIFGWKWKQNQKYERTQNSVKQEQFHFVKNI